MVPGKARPRGGLLLGVFVLVLLLDGLVVGDRVKVKDENRGSERVKARERLARVPDAAEGPSRVASGSWKDPHGLPELFSKKAEKSPAEEADVEEPRDDPGVLSGIYSRMKNWMFPDSSQETRKKLSDFRKRLAKRTESIVHTYTSLRDTVLPDKKGFDAPNFGYTRSGLDLVGYRKAQVPDLRPAELETSGDLVIRRKRALSLDTLIYGGSGVVYQATGVENAGKIGLGGYEDLKLVNFKNHLVAVTRDAEDEIVVHVAWNEDLQFVRSRVALGGTKFLLTVVGKVNNPGDLETDALLIAYIPTPDELDARVMIDELVLRNGTVERNHLQTIFGMTPSCLHAWKFAGEDFLLIMGSEPCTTSTDPNERCVDVYAFMGTYFDKKAIFDAPASSYIEPVIVGETLYIVTVVKDGNGSDDAESNVYEYKEELVSQSKGFEFSHSIVTRGAVHATSFTLGPREDREVFLVVANNCEDRVGEVGCDPHTKSTIFKHHEGKFHIFQNIDTYGAVQWHPLQVGSSVFLLLVSLAEDESKSVEVFHYDGSRFVTVDEIDDFQPGTVGVSSVSFHQRTYIGMACPKCDADNLYELIYTYENRAQNFRRSLGQWCNETLQALETSPTNISTLLDQARQMPGVEPGQIDFSDRDLVMENVTIDDLTILESGLVQLDLENLTDTSNGLRELVDNLTQKMETKLRVGISTWPERLTFDMLVLEDANVENLSVGMFGEEKAITWDDVVPLNGTQPLTLTQTFNDLVLTSSTEVDKLNGLPLADYMTANGSFVSPHKLIVEGVLQVDKLQVDGTVDSVTFDHQTILFADGIQSLQGSVTCDNLVTSNFSADLVNGISLDTIVLRSGNYTIEGNIEALDIVHPFNLAVDRISGYDMTSLEDRIFQKNYSNHQVITAKNLYANLEMEDMKVQGHLNGVGTSELIINDRNLAYHVNLLVFSDLEVEKINVWGDFDEMIKDGKHEFLLRHGHQILEGPKNIGHLHLMNDGQWVTPEIEQVEEIYDEYYTVRDGEQNTLMRQRDLDLCRSMTPDYGEGWLLETLESIGKDVKNIEDLRSGCTSNDIQCIQFSSGGELNLELQPNNYIKCLLNEMAVEESLKRDLLEKNVIDLSKREHLGTVSRTLLDLAYRIWLRYLDLVSESGCSYIPKSLNLGYLELCMDVKSWHEQELRNYEKFVDHMEDLVVIYKVKLSNPILADTKSNTNDHEEIIQTVGDLAKALQIELRCVIEDWNNTDVKNTSSLTPDGNIAQILLEHWTEKLEAHRYGLRKTINETTGAIMNYASCNPVHDHITFLQRFVTDLVSGVAEDEGPRKRRSLTVLANLQKSILNSTATEDGTATEVIGQVSEIEEALVNLKKNISRKLEQLMPDGLEYISKEDCEIFVDVSTLEDLQEDIVRLSASARPECERSSFAKVVADGAEVGKMLCSIVSQMMGEIYIIDQILAEAAPQSHSISRREILNVTMEELQETAIVQLQEPTLRPRSSIMMRARRSLGSKRQTLKNRKRHRESSPQQETTDEQRIPLMDVRPRSASSDHLGVQQVEPVSSTEQDSSSTSSAQPDREQIIALAMKIKKSKALATIWEIDCNGRERGKREATMGQIMNYLNRTLPKLIKYADMIIEDASRVVDNFSWYYIQRLAEHTKTINIIIAQTSFTFIDQIDDLKELCRRVPKTIESLQEYQNLLQAQLLYSGALLYRRLPRPVAGGSTVSKKISGVNITALWGHLVASIPDGDNVSAFILTNGINLANVYCLDELRVDGTLNNVNVNDIRENALRLNETFIYPELIFEIPVVVEGNLQIHSIDGKKVEFCGLESNVTFGMDVEATNLELLSDATVEKTVNGIDLDLEMERVAILQPGSSRTFNNFTRLVTFEYLDAEEVISSSTTLGGKDLDEVVLVNKNATVEGPVLVSNLTCLDSLSVGTMEATLVDGANPSEVLGDSLLAYSEDPQTVKGPMWVDQLRVKKNVTTMNGIQPMQGNGTLDLWSLKESVVYIDGELAELDSLTIEGNVTIRNIQCSSAFDGVSCRAFKGDWLLNMTEQDLFASSVEGLDVEDLEVAPGLTVGSINFLEFFDHCVKIDDNTTLPSPVHFENVMSLGSVDVAGTFDSLNLDEVALEYTPGGNIALGGRKTFANDFEFTGNFSVLGEVNGRDMRKVCSGKLDKLVIDGDAFFNDIKVNYVKTKNFIFPSESTSHFWMRNKEAVVKFPVEFDGLVVKNTTVTGQFNSEDLENLHNTVIYRSCPDDQVPRVVTANWTVQNLQASELVTSDLQVDTVNGFRVDVDDVMVTGRDQVITGNHEYEQLEVSGSVMSDRVQELDGTFVDFDAMCVYGRSCDVTAPKAFGTLVVDNLFGGTVNGIEFSEFAQDVVRRSSGGTVQGTTYFNESLTAPSLSVLGSINGEVIKPDMYLDKVSDQVMRGQLTIGRTQASDTVANFQDIMTEDLKYCGVNLNDLLHRTVNLQDPTVITGKVNFSSGVVFSNVTYKFLETMKLVREQPDQAEVMEDGYEGLRSKALMMKSSLESQPTEFMGWLKTQTYFDNYYKIIPLKGTDTLVPLKNVPFNSISILSSSSTSSSHWDTFTPPALFSNPSVDGVVLPTVRYLALLPWQRNFEVLRFDEEKRRFFGVEGWHFEGNCSTGVAGYRHGTHNYVASINTCPTPYTVDNASVVLRPYGANQSMEELAFVSEMAFNSTPRVHAVIATESGSDLQVVMLRGRPCLIVSQYSSLGCFVVCHGDTNSYDLSVVQLISLPYVTKISIVEHEWKTGTKDLFILMASTPQTTDHGTVHLLKYVVKDDRFYEIEVLREKKIVSVAGVSFQGEVLVAVAKAFMYNHHGGIAIHKLDENSRLKLVQILKEEYPWDVAFSPAPDGSLHLYVTNKMGAIMTYTKKGLGRFLKRREMHLEGAVSVVPFISYTDRGDGRPHPGHYLVAGGLPDRNDLSSWSGVSSVLLEGKYKGKNYEGRSPVPEIHPEF